MDSFVIKCLNERSPADKELIIEFFQDTLKLTAYESVYNLKIPERIIQQFKSAQISDVAIDTIDGNPETVLFIKEEEVKKFSYDFIRHKLCSVFSSVKNKGYERVTINIPIFNKDEIFLKYKKIYFSAFFEGIYYGAYSFDYFKKEKEKTSVKEVVFINADTQYMSSIHKQVQIIMESVYFSRDLINLPGNIITPHELAHRTIEKTREAKIDVAVLGEDELIQRGLNGIMSVGRASVNQPRLILLHYNPGLSDLKKIALVGKAVTYDAGGLSLKPTESMLDMKIDMSGGAVVIGAILAAAKLELPVEIIAVVPAVENVISGNAFKPGDIIRTYSGKSVEIRDTDAEGRLILADSIEYISTQHPEIIIDIATLTGGCVVGLGEFIAGLFSNDSKLAADLLAASENTDEHIWRLPLMDEFAEYIKSDIAEIKNLGPRWGSPITAAKFLESFVGKNIKWAHLDIAGPAGKSKFKSYTEKYNTAFGVRLLVDYLATAASEPYS